MKTEQTELFFNLAKNIEYMKTTSNDSADFTVREFTLDGPDNLSGTDCAIITIEGMVNKEVLASSVLNPVVRYGSGGDTGEMLLERIKTRLSSASEQVDVYTFEDAFAFAMSGFAVLAVDGTAHMMAIGVQGFSFRSISEPQTEIAQRGSREGFVEPLRINMTLLRRRMKNPNLKFETMRIGSVSKTDICLAYLTDVVSDKILQSVKRRIENTDIATVLASGYLVDFLEDRHKMSIFSGVGLSERPDTVCGKIAEGRIAVMIDGTPSVLIVPYLFAENFQTLDDYSNRPYFATLTRWLKYLAFFVAVLSPGIYVAAVMYNPEILPAQTLSKIAASVASTPLPIVLEVLVIHFVYEIMREAGLRLPRSLGHAVSIVGALVIGDTAVNAGLIGAPTLMIVALTAISSYVIPNLYAPIAILRFVFIIVGGFFGIWGVALAFCTVLVSVCSKSSFGVPFTSPVAPLSMYSLRDVLVRASWKTLSKRRFVIQNTEYPDKDNCTEKEQPDEQT